MKAHLQKLSKILAMLLLIAAGFSACKKDKVPTPEPKPTETKPTTVASGTIDGKTFNVKDNAISSTVYSTSGDNVKAMETSATIGNDGSKLTFFLNDLKNGTASLSKKSGTSLNPGTRTIKINETSNTSQTYVQYYNGGNAYYAFSGTIEITVTDTYVKAKWNISFKDATGREFTSAGEFTITFATVIAKAKSEIKDPTPVADKPTVENISPTKGRAGDEIAITGVNYSTTAADNVVMFNGKVAEVVSATATKLTVKAPQGGSTGTISVKVKNSETVTGPTFTYLQAATFTSFAPASAKAGETVTITGTNFSTVVAENVVKFAGAQNTTVAATVTEATATQLKVTVPQTAATGKIIVNVLNGGNLTSATDFTLTTTTTTGDWEDMKFNTSIQEVNLSANLGNSFMFMGGSFPDYLYYTADGTSYTNVYANIPKDPNGHLEIHLIKSDGVNYYLTTNQGIFRTKDGVTWKKLLPSPNLPNLNVNALIASRGGNLAFISGGFLYRSADYGDTWTNKYVVNGNNLDYLTSDSFGKYWYAVDISQNYLSAAGPRKMYRSTDQGETWTAGDATTGIYYFGSGNQDFITASGYTIFCLYSTSTTQASIVDQRLYKTSTQGNTWTKVSDDNVYYVKAFGDYVVYGDGRFNVSADNGATFKDYSLPDSYRVGGVERVNGYFYVFAFKNNGQHRIFRRKI
ncbi:hypothetical protein D0C36_11630 [Mucilaginibacter conchicola]|uniref:IPT/TIG domain-containing protein n=1 Tax=Mucilaginibacter conchicola TaxID=2303333 RepID=A0A372NTT5_9SPHI|nr:IPT/TIG domain-containing protein [Mucilaginibacter conchicola]RFZ92089.1 hypothetical protein D0C36_11630 [Mucilaginibacter conchicola]